MAVRGFSFKLKRWLAIFLAMMSLAVVILWADSYRPWTGERPRQVSLPDTASHLEFLKNIFITYDPRTPPSDKFGIRFVHFFGDQSWVRMLTRQGVIVFSMFTGVKNAAANQMIDLMWHDYGYSQCVIPIKTLASYADGSDINDDYLIREVWLPFWAIFFLCAAYPAIYFVRGPLRRRRRRRRGLCIECGYDLSHSPERCPECGAASAADSG